MFESVEVGGYHAGYTVYMDSKPFIWNDLVDSWVNIDKYFAPNSISKQFSSHVLEHLTYPLQYAALKSTLKILKPGGEMELDTPDFQGLIKLYNESKVTLLNLQRTMFGEQDYEENTHRFCHTPESLYRLLAKIGFVVKRIIPENGTVKAIAIKPEIGWDYYSDSGIMIYRKIA